MLDIDHLIATRLEINQVSHERDTLTNTRQKRRRCVLIQQMHGVWQRHALPDSVLIDYSKTHTIANAAFVFFHAGPPVVWVGLVGTADLTTGCVRHPFAHPARPSDHSPAGAGKEPGNV